MTSGVPAQGLDLDEIERRLVGTRREAIEVLPDVPALTAELRALREFAAHLEAELARATGEVGRLSEENERERKIAAAYKGWRGREVVEAKTNLTTLVKVANIECDHALQDLAAERERREALEVFARWLIAMDDPADAVALSDRQRVTLTRIINRARAALSGDTGGEDDTQGGLSMPSERGGLTRETRESALRGAQRAQRDRQINQPARSQSQDSSLSGDTGGER